MSSRPITIQTMLSDSMFRDFANFDIFTLRKRFIRPVMFFAILSVCAVFCYILDNGSNQGSFLATVLLIVAAGLPAVYFGLYFRSLGFQIKQMGLSKPRHVYTVELSDSDDGIHTIDKPDPRLGEKSDTDHIFRWSEAYGAYRRKNCIYLYVSDRQAYIIPDGQADTTSENVWSFISSHMDASKLHS